MTVYTFTITDDREDDHDAVRFRDEIERALGVWLHRPSLGVSVTRSTLGISVNLDWTEEQIAAADEVIRQRAIDRALDTEEFVVRSRLSGQFFGTKMEDPYEKGRRLREERENGDGER